MKVAVGSANPVKIAAVENVVKRAWPGAVVEGVSVSSDVSEMPMSSKEAIQGATNRAKAALTKLNADLGIGLEGSAIDTEHGMFMTGWTVAVHSDGRVGVGGGGSILLPEKIAKELRKGRELGPVIDEVIGQHNTKQNQGTTGVLTNGLLNRTQAFEHQVINALALFLKEELYKK